jgi:hypothetical protein
MRFYGGTFAEYWHMDARRFFAMHNAMCKLEALEHLEAVDIQAVAICGEKYVKGLKERYAQRFDGGDEPDEEEIVRAEINDEQTTRVLMERLADFKRVNFGR